MESYHNMIWIPGFSLAEPICIEVYKEVSAFLFAPQGHVKANLNMWHMEMQNKA